MLGPALLLSAVAASTALPAESTEPASAVDCPPVVTMQCYPTSAAHCCALVATGNRSCPSRPHAAWEAQACGGIEVQLQCAATCGGGGTWRGGDAMLAARVAGRHVSGPFLCEATGRTVAVLLVPLYSPTVRVWREEGGGAAQCMSDASPRAAPQWLRDGLPLSAATASGGACEVAHARLELKEDQRGTELLCEASNALGRAGAVLEWSEEGERRFNVTGFALGMLPPLLVALYIVLALGHRSRYADDRADDPEG